MNKSDLTKKLTDIYIESEGNFFDKTADWIEANFTPKGEAEKVTAARIYEIMIGSSNWDDCYFYFLAEQAHEAARAFNEYKPE